MTWIVGIVTSHTRDKSVLFELGTAIKTKGTFFSHRSQITSGRWARHWSLCVLVSEVFYDHGEEYLGVGLQASPEEDWHRFIEIWNVVFMQFSIVSADGTYGAVCLSLLFDTALGLERIAAILQGAT